jgi:hypothetical protein
MERCQGPCCWMSRSSMPSSNSGSCDELPHGSHKI